MLPDERTLWGEKCPLKKPTKKNNGYIEEKLISSIQKGFMPKDMQKDEKRNIEQIKTAISISKGNLTQAAALLGISRPTLYKKMSIHGISK